MTQLEVFFDYACPYCLRGHTDLMELLPHYPQLEIVWRPCESHPRPDSYGPHSDLCIQGMFFAMAHGANLFEYHERMYQAALVDQIDIENMVVLSEYVADIVDADAFRTALWTQKYREPQQAANDYAFRQSGVWVVPAYRMAGNKLDSVENVGVSLKQLRRFLDRSLMMD